mgnify:FL=1
MNSIAAEDILRRDMVRHGRSLFERALSGGNSGNLSTSLPDGRLLTTPTGRSLGDLRADALSLLDGPPPTKEVPMHLACYAANADCGAVVHLYSPYATAQACLANLDPADCLPPLTPYFVLRIGALPLAPYRMPGSPNIGTDLARLLPGRTAVLLANPGSVVCGPSLETAVGNSEELEATARLYFILNGQAARPLNAEERAALHPHSANPSRT